MENQIYGALVYNDEQLYAIAYNVFESQVYLAFRDEIYQGDIKKCKTDDEIIEVAESVNVVFKRIEDELAVRIRTIDLIVDPDTFYFETKSFRTGEFEEEHVLVASDVEKITSRALRYDSANDGYAAANFTANEFFIDDVQKSKPIGESGKNFVFNGELVYIDDATLHPLERIISESKYTKDNVIVSSHLLKYTSKFENKDAIIEFGRSKMKFITKNDDLVQNFAMDFGIGHMYEKVYLELVNTFEPEASEQVVRYLQNNFKLEKIKFDFDIVEGISFNHVVALFRGIASEYVQGILLQVLKQGIEIKRIYSITNDYSNDEWVRFLQSVLELEVKEYKVPAISGNFKSDLKVSNAIVINDKMRMKG